MNKTSIYGLTYTQLQTWLVEHGQQRFRAQQVWDWLYRKRVTKFTDMKNLNKDCIKLLEDHFIIHSLEPEIRQESSDGTIKFLFKLADGNLIETVLMRFNYGLSVCVTTQVGCNIGCTFCASGLLSKSRDLSSGEIVEQIMNVQRGEPKKLQPPIENVQEVWSEAEQMAVKKRSQAKSTIIGDPSTVKQKLENFLNETKANEIIINSQIFHHEDRLRSYEIVAEMMD